MHLKRRKWLSALSRPAQGYWASRVSRPLFIIGCSRSGTTLLSRLMSSHRDVAEWSEANDVWDPIPVRRDADGRPLHFWDDTEGYLQSWRADLPTLGPQIRAIFGMYQALMGRQKLVNKSPINTFRIPEMLALFPDAQFVHMVRDGRAVSVSYAYKLAQKMGEHPEQYDQAVRGLPFDQMVVRLAGFWQANLAEVARQDAALGLTGHGALLELTYEALCDDRAQALGQICRFAGLDADRFGPGLAREPVSSRNDKWRSEVDPTLLDRMVRCMEPELSARGYGS